MDSLPTSPIRDIAARAEWIEAEAFAQLQLGLPDALQAELGMEVHRYGPVTSLLAAGADVATVNRTIALGFDGMLDDEGLSAVCAPYVAARVPRWLVEWSPEASPRDDSDLFARHGGRAKTPIAKMWGALADDGVPVSHSERLRVDVIGRESAASFQAIVAPSLGIPSILEALTTSTLGHAHWHHYLAFAGQEAVAGAAMFTLNGGAWFGLAATLPHARGRGAQKLLLARRMRDALELGCKWATAETMPDSPEQPNPSYRNMCGAGMPLLYHKAKYVFTGVNAG